jgi:drug/metabolite transporter (DMT)-like permease
MPNTPAKAAVAGTLCIACTLIGWASVPLFLKYFTLTDHYLDPWTANGWRYPMSALILLPVLIAHAAGRGLPAGIWRRALVPTVFNCLGQTCFALAPYYIEPGLMAFLLRFQIIFVTLGAYLFFPAERHVLRSKAYWTGVAIVFCGLAGTVLLGEQRLVGGTALGVLFGVGSGVLFAGYALSVRHFMHGVNPFVSFGAISQLTSVVLITVMFAVSPAGAAAPLALPPIAWVILVASSLIGIALGHVFYYAAIARLGVAISGGVILLAPFLTAIASMLVYEERLTIGQWLSGTTALVGAAMILSRQRRYTHAPDVPPLPAIPAPVLVPVELGPEAPEGVSELPGTDAPR